MEFSTGPPSVALTSLLNSLHTHLQTQTNLLPKLHAQLGLSPSALEEELVALQHELTACVERQVEGRRAQVEEWVGKCEEVERECERYTVALGAHIKSAGTPLADMKKEVVLPRRYAVMSEYQEKLRQLYHTKLEQINTLINRLVALTRTLGPSYFPPEILAPALVHPDLISPNAEPHHDVAPERFLKLEKELVRGKAEVSKRLVQLHQRMTYLDWMHTELGLEVPQTDAPNSVASSSSSLLAPSNNLSRPSSSCGFNVSSDPFLSTPTPLGRKTSNAAMLFVTSTPSLQSSPENEESDVAHERVFARFSAKLAQAAQEGLALPENVGLEGVEPTPSLLSWVERTHSALEDLKRRREAHIQALYDQLETLWRRLGVTEAEMDAFVDANQGSTEATVRAYEVELDNMMELKREKMGAFVQNAREEIGKLWDELMIGEDERAEFTPFTNDEFTEELLALHEAEVRRLKDEKIVKAPLLASIKKYFDVCEDERALAASANDQSRLLGRGTRGDPGRLLREEKMRKRVQKEKPKLEHDLLISIPAWEAETGRLFLVHGQRIMDLLAETAAAAESAKENVGSKRKSSSSTGRAPSVPPRGTTPAPSANAKATGTNGPPNKRQRLGSVEPPATIRRVEPPSTMRRTTRSATAAARTPGKTPQIRAGRSGARGGGTTAIGHQRSTSVSQPQTQVPQTQPRMAASMGAVANGMRVFGATATNGKTMTNVKDATTTTAKAAPQPLVRRASFKPRPSSEVGFNLAASTGFGINIGGPKWPGLAGMVKEENES